MTIRIATDDHHTVIRAEMRALGLPGHAPLSPLFFALVGVMSTASTLLSLAGL